MILLQCFCGVFVIFFIKAYVVDTHLNCIDESMQFKWVSTTYAYIKKLTKKYTGCNLKNMDLLDCELIRVCVVIRPNTVCQACLSLLKRSLL